MCAKVLLLVEYFFSMKWVPEMKLAIIPSVALLVITIGSATRAADLESGLQVGDRAGAFNVKDCTGPAEGKSLCYR